MSISTPLQTLFSHGFRPLFLGAGLFAILATAAWLLVLMGYSPLPLGNPLLWHSHEMLVGFVGAAMGGFLLTAVPNWTGSAPLRGTGLVVLCLLWLAGRLAAAAAEVLPLAVVAIVDLSFSVMLIISITNAVVKGGNRRNYPILGLIGLTVLLNGCYHVAPWLGVNPLTFLYLYIHVVLLLITIIGGRITPNFTANWLKQRGAVRLPRRYLALEVATIALTVAVGLSDSLWPGSGASGLCALAAAAAHGLRLSQWRGLATRGEPLMVVLHVGYGWLVVGYGLLAMSVFMAELPRSAALHTLTLGAIGTMIIAVMSRASLGHTGRPLTASRLLALAFALVSVAALLRLGAGLWMSLYTPLIHASGGVWIAAFGLFVLLFAPMLLRPRQ